MSSRPRKLPAEAAAYKFSELVAADYIRAEFFGELRLHDGRNYAAYSTLSASSTANNVTHYGGITVERHNGRIAPEDAFSLGVPTTKPLWIAHAITADIPARSSGDTAASKKRGWNQIGAGFFWVTNTRYWHTDNREIATPRLLGSMAQEQIKRADLIKYIRDIGAQAVLREIENMDDISIEIETDAGVSHKAVFDASNILHAIDRYRLGLRPSPNVFGQTLPEVFTALL